MIIVTLQQMQFWVYHTEVVMTLSENIVHMCYMNSECQNAGSYKVHEYRVRQCVQNQSTKASVTRLLHLRMLHRPVNK